METKSFQEDPVYPQLTNPSYNPDEAQPPPPYEPPAQQPEAQTYPQQCTYPSNVSVVTVPAQLQNVQAVDDNMMLSIVSLFFCCILGIFAIIKSSEARDHKLKGRYHQAESAARSARTIAMVGIVVGSISALIGIVMAIVFPLVIFASTPTYSYKSDFD
ncbi:hypothetical protein EGW08_009982 [Elysia chlorotica]|uniref:Uncharacterized protein n=1 Tax=Elysia chlorotica TaxID=188477 RepID=A0A3S1C3U5_ELYCH|nr:hypothetical protein EGW08_009982 [Elysia chlorotica]